MYAKYAPRVASSVPNAPNATVPDFTSGGLDDAKLTRTIKAVDLLLRKRIDGVLEGNFLGIVPGLGSEPGEHRLYQIGDDVRLIDWNATARTLQTQIRQTVADRELEAWIVIDLSESLNFGSGACTKRDLAILGAAAIIRLVMGHGNKIGVIIINGKALQVIPAGSGSMHAMTILRAIINTRSVSSDAVGLDDALVLLKKLFRKKGLITIISDFLGSMNWEQSLRGLSVHHTVVAIEVLDPRDYDIPALGEVNLYDAETGKSKSIVVTKKVRDLYAQATYEQSEALKKIFSKYHIPVMHLNTSREWSIDFSKFVDHYKRAR